MKSFVTRAITSMEVICEVFIKYFNAGRVKIKFSLCQAWIFMENLLKCIPVIPRTEREKQLYEEALNRRN